MKVGIEMCHGFIQDIGFDDFVPGFERAKAFGFSGMYYKSPQYIAKDLDPGRLKAARQYANELGLYLEGARLAGKLPRPGILLAAHPGRGPPPAGPTPRGR